MEQLNENARNELGDILQRLESLIGEKAQVSARIKAEYDAAAGAGFDKKVIKQLIRERASDDERSIVHRRLVETYRKALAGLAGTPLGDWARAWMAQDARHDARAGAATPLEEWMAARKAKGGDDGAPRPGA